MISIDVVIPAYNAARTLSETLDSVFRQTHTPRRIIVVDDGSEDATASIAEAAGAEVLRQQNRGAAAALNAGLRRCGADAIAFSDADDLWPEDKLLCQTNLLLANPLCDAAIGLMESFICPSLRAEDRRRYVLSPVQTGWCLGAMLARRGAFDQVGYFDESLRAMHAVDWFDRARRAGISFEIDQQVALKRRLHPGSLGHRSTAFDAAVLETARRALARRRMSDVAQ